MSASSVVSAQAAEDLVGDRVVGEASVEGFGDVHGPQLPEQTARLVPDRGPDARLERVHRSLPEPPPVSPDGPDEEQSLILQETPLHAQEERDRGAHEMAASWLTTGAQIPSMSRRLSGDRGPNSMGSEPGVRTEPSSP